jgi:hypothetical protein
VESNSVVGDWPKSESQLEQEYENTGETRRTNDLLLREWIIFEFRHGEIFAIVGHQGAVMLQSDGGDDGVGQSESATFSGPSILESSRKLGRGVGKRIAVKRIKKFFSLSLFLRSHPGEHFGDV